MDVETQYFASLVCNSQKCLVRIRVVSETQNIASLHKRSIFNPLKILAGKFISNITTRNLPI